jgi:hypothetical protein
MVGFQPSQRSGYHGGKEESQSENEEESQSQSETEEESQEESQEEIAGLRHSNDKPSSFSGSGVRPLPLSILTLTSQERAR